MANGIYRTDSLGEIKQKRKEIFHSDFMIFCILIFGLQSDCDFLNSSISDQILLNELFFFPISILQQQAICPC
jgi:hypothetical protein